MAAGEASLSNAASSSVAMGRALANSAASSSFASGVTGNLDVGKRLWLGDAELARLRKLEQPKQRGKYLPRLSGSVHEVGPPHACADGEHGTDQGDGAGDVEAARNDLVHLRLGGHAKHPVDGGQEL